MKIKIKDKEELNKAYGAIASEQTPIKKEYPYGSKCPQCGAPTATTSRGIGPNQPESCKNGHTYPRGQAIKVTE